MGSIFIDGRCKNDSNKLIIYGHNIKSSDSMFGALTKYKRESYYVQHRFIKFDTLYEKGIYEIVAVSKAIAYYDIDVNAEYGDKLITLVTCDYWTKNARLVIVAKKL